MSKQPPPTPQKPARSEADQPPPSTQGRLDFRKKLPMWIKELPQFGRFQPEKPDSAYQLIDRESLRQVLESAPEPVRQEILEDIDFMNYELMRLFRDRDYRAKYNQNRYRRLQINFLILAVGATLIGSLQVITLSTNPEIMPLFAFLETVVALFTAFLAAVGGREPPQQQWLTNRRRAEQLRREYFRFLTRMPPYDEVQGYERRMLLSQRAADINRGMYPQDGSAPGTTLSVGGENGTV